MGEKGGKCSKVRYPSALEAELALASTRHAGIRKHGRVESRYYHCPRCDGYHLTSMPLAQGSSK